ncbi:MAG: hypothetical protein ACI81L_003181 [Verrucomicrobiales bacterium]|jgi:hypothetical protein
MFSSGNNHFSFFRIFAVVLGLTVFASACAADAEPAESAADAEPAESAADAEPAESAADAEPAESVRDLCDIAREQKFHADAFDPFGSDPEEIEAFFDDQLALVAEAIAAAPNDALKADLEVIQVEQIEMRSLIQAADWNIFAIDPDAMDETLDQPGLDIATDRVEAYGVSECGIPADDEGDPENESFEGDPENESFEGDPEFFAALLESPMMRATIVEGMVAESDVTEDQANCYLDAMIEAGLLELMNQELDAAMAIKALELFDQCGINPNAFD